MNEIEIIPAILPKNYFELEEKADLVKGLVPMLQLDICDGKFVPSRTWPYFGADTNRDDIFAQIIAEDRGLPFWDEVDYEIHLMVTDPDQRVQDWVAAGAARILVPAETVQDLPDLVDRFGEWVEIGVNLNSETSEEVIAPYADRIRSVQCMGIKKIGFQGQPFEVSVLEKVSRIKARYPHITVSVDGGVNRETIRSLKEAGAARFAVGSALFSEGNIAQAIHDLERA